MSFGRKLLSVFVSLWFEWIILTITYFIYVAATGWYKDSATPAREFIGRFVPAGPFTLAAMFGSQLGLVVLPLLLCCLFLGEFIGKKYVRIPLIRVAYNTLFLFVLTFAYDNFVVFILLGRH